MSEHFDARHFEVRNRGLSEWDIYYRQRYLLILNRFSGEAKVAPGAEPEDWASCYQGIIKQAALEGFAHSSESGQVERSRLVISFIKKSASTRLPAWAWTLALRESGVGAKLQRLSVGEDVYPLWVGGRFIFLELGSVQATAADLMDEADFVKQHRAHPDGVHGVLLDLDAPGDWILRNALGGRPVAWSATSLSQDRMDAVKLALLTIAVELSDGWRKWAERAYPNLTPSTPGKAPI